MALTAALTDLLNDQDQRLAMARAARARTETEFDQDVMVKRVLGVYEGDCFCFLGPPAVN